MTGKCIPNEHSAGHLVVADVLSAIGLLLRECHRESLALQDAVSTTLPLDDASHSRLATYQALDHVTQVQDDLAHLLPALADALRNRQIAPGELSANLRLVSLRQRLFGAGGSADSASAPPGEVNFF